MALTVTLESTLNYLRATFDSDSVEGDLRLPIVEVSSRAIDLRSKGVLYDLSKLFTFEMNSENIRGWTGFLSQQFSKEIRYAFFVRKDQIKRRDYWDALFWCDGHKVRTTSDIEEANTWLKGDGLEYSFLSICQ